MNEVEKAIKTISDIYSAYLSSETDTVNLMPYDEALQEVDTVLEQALQTQAERDKMRCENCKYFFCESAVDRYFHCNNFHGLKNIDVIENKTFCSYFEPKENENE